MASEKPKPVPGKNAAGKRTAIPLAIERWVKERDDGKCAKCGAPGDDLHHIVEVCDGGMHDVDNLDTLCYRCHREVTDGIPSFLTYAEWLQTPPAWQFAIAYAVSRKDTADGRKLRKQLESMTAAEFFATLRAGQILATGRGE